MNKEALQSLGSYTGTEHYFKHALFPILVYTDGVKALMEAASAYWLLDAIASHQPQALKDPVLRDMQFWTLRQKGNGAELIGERDTGDVAITQDIPWTDFPFDALKEAKIWVAPTSLDGRNTVWVAYLPSEH